MNKTAAHGVRYDEGSFRDPSGSVFHYDGRVFRTVSPRAARNYEFCRDRKILFELMDCGHIPMTCERKPEEFGVAVPYVLEHATIPFISYPYEWCFRALQSAAIFHLELHLKLLSLGATLSDASAYNIQFDGTRAVFIDVLSIRPYLEGEYWRGHRQFCEQFLFPLLMNAKMGVPHNHWYRGNLEGISLRDIHSILPATSRMSMRTMLHIHIPAIMQSWSEKGNTAKFARGNARGLPKSSLVRMLSSLCRWVCDLKPWRIGGSIWSKYDESVAMRSGEADAKEMAVKEYSRLHRPGVLLDLGCNLGRYSRVALANGAKRAVGFDADTDVVDSAFRNSEADGTNFLPLVMDISNPSPGQGWNQCERKGLAERCGNDGLIAMAFVHHLCLSRNIPLRSAVEWVVGLSKSGIIEFVPKDDPKVQQMLRFRDDVFDDYTLDSFRSGISRMVRITKEMPVSSTGRILVWFER